MKTAKKGFTLVELMVVIVIIGILAALAIPRFLGATNKTKAAEFKPVLKQIYTLQMAYKQEKDVFSADADGSDIGFEAPSGNKARFSYTIKQPAADAPGVANDLGSAAPNAQGQEIKYNGTNKLAANDLACIDPVGNMYADDNLAMISGVDKGNCP